MVRLYIVPLVLWKKKIHVGTVKLVVIKPSQRLLRHTYNVQKVEHKGGNTDRSDLQT